MGRAERIKEGDRIAAPHFSISGISVTLRTLYCVDSKLKVVYNDSVR